MKIIKTEKMKMYLIILICLLLFAMTALSANAYFYKITSKCKNGICIEGETASWEVVMTNDGNTRVEFISIELVDFLNGSKFADLKFKFNPASSERGNYLVLRPDASVLVNFSAPLPAANFGELLVYYPCITIAIGSDYLVARDGSYTNRQCFNQNDSLKLFQCLQDVNCEETQFCRFRKCQKLECGACQYIDNHACADYECCGDMQCSMDGFCRNNTCRKLACSNTEYVFNHTCVNLDCADDEYILNRTCRKLACGYDEYPFNNTCTKLECEDDEFVLNHTCQLLECAENEFASNHICYPLQCSFNESVFNHRCITLNCSFFQDEIEHECVNNVTVITKLILELIAIIIIVLFILLDFKKYEASHKPKITGSSEKLINPGLFNKK